MRLIFLCLFILSAALLTAQPVTDNLVAYFSFDDCTAVVDDSGNGSAAQLVGNPECACGLGESSFRFNGEDEAIYFGGPLAAIFTTSDFTISFYINPRKVPSGTQIIMANQEDCTTQPAFWVRYTNAQSANLLSAGISESPTQQAMVMGKLDPGRCWQLVTLVRNNTRFALYLNGTFRDEDFSDGRINLTSNNTYLKISEPVCPLTDLPFNGRLDELRIYSKALDDDEIETLDLQPDRILTDDSQIYLGNSINVRADTTTCAQIFKWSPADGVSDIEVLEPVITPLLPATYLLTMSDSASLCQAVDTFRIKVIDPDTLNCDTLYMPNAFTPDGAGPEKNSTFPPPPAFFQFPFPANDFISLEIFDRWGGRVFAAKDSFDTWDGTFQNQPVNPGVFLYRLYYRCNGKEKVKTNTLTLLR